MVVSLHSFVNKEMLGLVGVCFFGLVGGGFFLKGTEVFLVCG